MMISTWYLKLQFLGTCLLYAAAALTPDACSNFTIKIPNTTIASTTYYSTSSLNLSGIVNTVPACQINATLSPTPLQRIEFSILLPLASQWNKYLVTVGNGGFAGVIDTAAMMQNLNKGYATAGGNGGHDNATSPAGGDYVPWMHDVRLNDWIRDSIHEITDPIKEIVRSYYGEQAKGAYFEGCSTGGAQGMALAELYPEDYDGIHAQCPGMYYTNLLMSFIWNDRISRNTDITQMQLEFLYNAVVKACDGIDGVYDNLISDPIDCLFDPSSLLCSSPSSGNSSTCFTPPQLVAINAIYSGAKDSLGRQIYPGMIYGSELNWAYQLSSPNDENLAHLYALPFLQNAVYNNLSWTLDDFDFDTDPEIVNAAVGRNITAISTNLTAFEKAGGKLILTQAMYDQLNAQTYPFRYYQNVVDETFGGDYARVGDFFNVFEVPGAYHCAAGVGGDTVGVVDALVRWRESEEVPEELGTVLEESGGVVRRKVCRWPLKVRYLGGDPGVEASFKCQ